MRLLRRLLAAVAVGALTSGVAEAETMSRHRVIGCYNSIAHSLRGISHPDAGYASSSVDGMVDAMRQVSSDAFKVLTDVYESEFRSACSLAPLLRRQVSRYRNGEISETQLAAFLRFVTEHALSL